MLYFPNSRQYISIELPVAAGSQITAEGQAVIGDNTGGVFGVKPSGGAAGETFIGVSVSQQMALTFASKVEEAVQGSSNTVTLNRTPSAGTLGVYDITAGAVVPAGAGGWTLAGKVVTLQAGTQGHTIAFTYRYAPTATEARTLQGDVYPGGPAGALVNQVGVIKNGIVYTDQFDTSVDWRVASPTIKLAANGLFTTAGSGVTVPVSLVSIPSVAQPFLGLMLNG